MRKYKRKLIFLIMIISLIGVGFAAWSVVVPTDDANLNGDFSSDDVVLVEALSDPLFDRELKYNKNGFFTQYKYNELDDTLSSVTYNNITYSVNIDFNECRKLMTGTNQPKSFQIVISLEDQSKYVEINNILSLVHRTINVDGVTVLSKGYEVKDGKINAYVTFTIPEDLTVTSTSATVNYDFSEVATDGSNTTITGFFDALSKLDNDRAFIVSASLYAIYE